MEEIRIKTHLIITDVHDEYNMNWCGKISKANPLLEDGLPVFIVAGSNGRVKMSTTDMKRLEECAKRMTRPRGREATTKDQACIYIKEVDGNEMLIGVLTHYHIKHYAPMYDKVGYR